MKTWNPHRYLIAAARRVWRWSDGHREAGKLCAVGTTKRKCALCNEVYPRREVHIDHIDPVGKGPKDWDDYPAYYRRLFCPVTNLQGACETCHKAKSKAEGKVRRGKGGESNGK